MNYDPPSKPATFLEWLMIPYAMQAETGGEYWSPTETMIDIVSDCVALLSTQDQELIHRVFYERETYEQLASSIGLRAKSYAWTKTQKAVANLKELLINHPTFKEVFAMNVRQTWNNSALEAVQHLADVATNTIYNPDYFTVVVDTISAWVLAGCPEKEDQTVFSICDYAGVHAMLMLGEHEVFSIEEMTHLLVKKQHDYGHKNIELFGLIGLAVRLCDKIARQQNLVGRNYGAENESYVDTLRDIVGYSVLCYMWNKDSFSNELEQDMV